MPESANFPVRIDVKVRFADVDFVGHLNHAKFFTYMEEARLAYLALHPELDLVGREAGKGLTFVLVNASCDFLAPAHLGDVVAVGARVRQMGTKSVTMEYRLLHRESGKIIGQGATTAVVYNLESKAAVAIPAALRARIEQLEAQGKPLV